jgi:hypothetical protein
MFLLRSSGSFNLSNGDFITLGGVVFRFGFFLVRVVSFWVFLLVLGSTCTLAVGAVVVGRVTVVAGVAEVVTGLDNTGVILVGAAAGAAAGSLPGSPTVGLAPPGVAAGIPAAGPSGLAPPGVAAGIPAAGPSGLAPPGASGPLVS